MARGRVMAPGPDESFLAFPHGFEAFLSRPELYLHAKLAHVLAATLFFGNVVIGTIWETRSLVSKRAEIIRYTYATVAWLENGIG